ncbi:hypothetical protein LEP1GSC005_3382 [Leptospira santarosai str. ST188]|nr:hypothetical protein LEP1GSC005_3382 [Leptospira santarosai str. ST188]
MKEKNFLGSDPFRGKTFLRLHATSGLIRDLFLSELLPDSLP